MTRRKKLYVTIIVVIVAGIIVAFGASWGVSAYLNKQYASLHDGCSPNQPNHTVVVKDDKAVPSSTTAKRCDTLTITNLDDESRLMAFGPHEHHVPYDGIAEQTLARGQSFTVTLAQTGNFRVHDHEHDEVQAVFQVK